MGTNTDGLSYLLHSKRSVIQNHTMNVINLFVSDWDFWKTRLRVIFCAVPATQPTPSLLDRNGRPQ